MPSTQAPSSPDLAGRLQTQAIIAWVVTAVGTVTFHLLHLYAAVGEVAALADGHGHDHAHDHGEGGGHLDFYTSLTDHNSGSAWQLVIFLALMVIPPAIGLAYATKAGAIIMMATGLIHALAMSLDGFAHGLGEGAWSTLALTLVAILTPAAIATIRNIQWLRAFPTHGAAA
ncbi:MAG: hypothetical protein QM708_13965 [Propioniciclava sp.]|uniref:hypothetical protein n=1 Tax=Propioniciclava sp. TaxID=2038686 RepID=UPI0039E4FD04